MKAPPDSLAIRVTRKESLQSYLTMRLLADHDLVEDSFRAYAYFRWADDMVDKLPASGAERLGFIRGQRELIEGLYRGIRPGDLSREEVMVADLIQNDRVPKSRLRSYIENFLAIIEFDAVRRGRRITEAELREYSDQLAVAVTDAIQYFIKNGHAYPEEDSRIAAARAAHVTHMLRDYHEDLVAGYWNIPDEYLEAHGIGPGDIESPAFLAWVRMRVEEAREGFRLGKGYIDRLDVLRTKIAASWYCAHFEHVLDSIEKDGYHLRLGYATRHPSGAWFRMLWVAARVTARHARSGMRAALRVGPRRARAVHRPTTDPRRRRDSSLHLGGFSGTRSG